MIADYSAESPPPYPPIPAPRPRAPRAYLRLQQVCDCGLKVEALLMEDTDGAAPGSVEWLQRFEPSQKNIKCQIRNRVLWHRRTTTQRRGGVRPSGNQCRSRLGTGASPAAVGRDWDWQCRPKAGTGWHW
eukprot:3007068-Prymnesium_polylepis.1